MGTCTRCGRRTTDDPDYEWPGMCAACSNRDMRDEQIASLTARLAASEAALVLEKSVTENWTERATEAVEAAARAAEAAVQLQGDVERLAIDLTAALARAEKAEASNEHDRTRVCETVMQMIGLLRAYSWLCDSRGSYDCDDEKYQQEFGRVHDALTKALEPLRRIAADWSNCPQTQLEIAEAKKSNEVLRFERDSALAKLREVEGERDRLRVENERALDLVRSEADSLRKRGLITCDEWEDMYSRDTFTRLLGYQERYSKLERLAVLQKKYRKVKISLAAAREDAVRGFVAYVYDVLRARYIQSRSDWNSNADEYLASLAGKEPSDG